MSKAITSQLYWTERIKKLSNYRDALEINTDKLIAQKYAASAKRLKAYLNDLLADIEANKVNGGYVTMNDLYQYNRYYDIINKINEELKLLGESEAVILSDDLKVLYKNNASEIGKLLEVTQVDDEAMDRAVYDVWCSDNKTWNDRIWSNQTELAQQLQDGIIDCITTGKSTKQLAKVISDRYNVGLAYSQRLVRTEMTHVQNQASYDRYKEAGVDRYKVIGFRDNSTCEICKKHQGQVYLMAQKEEGVNCPPDHPNCRCSIIPIIN